MPSRQEADKATREDVYLAIDSERDYQDSLWDSKQMENKTIGDWVTVLRVYLRRAEDSWMYDGDHKPLDVIRKIAAVGVHAMELLGAVERYDGTVKASGYFLGSPTRKEVYNLLDAERKYQDNKWKGLDDRNSVGDFITYMVNLSREADSLSNPDYPERSLNIIRKLTAVAISCMEKFGSPLREEPDYGKPKNNNTQI